MVWARVVALVAVVASCGSSVAAGPTCGYYDMIVERLTETYNEARRGQGLAGSQALIELWTDPADGSWSLLRVNPSGWTCLIGSGQNWTDDEPTPEGRPI